MTKQKKLAKNPKPLPKPEKAKWLVNLGRSTYIDEIYKKAESQPSVGLRKVTSKQPTSSLQASGSPSEAFAEVHSQTDEQDFQEIEILFQNNCKKGISVIFVKEKGKLGKLGSQDLLLE